MRRLRRGPFGFVGSTAFGGSTGATALLPTPSPAAAALQTGTGSTAFAAQSAPSVSHAFVSQVGDTNAALNPVVVTAQREAVPAASAGASTGLFGLSTTQLLIIGGLLVVGGVILFSSKRRK